MSISEQGDRQKPEQTDLFHGDDPFALFAKWLAQAQQAEINDAEAMSLATLDAHNRPDIRMVLLKHADAEGFVFYTNARSQKGKQLAAHPVAALCLHWKSLRRQVRIRGPVASIDPAQADTYFASRSLHSRIGAWASEQSEPLSDRSELEARFVQFQQQFADSEPPRPAHWQGYRVIPHQIEFWRDGAFRLHERVLFIREGQTWQRQMLNP